MQEGQAMFPEPPKIFAAIAGVINDIGVVSKDKVNKQQGFKYRSVDDVYSVLNPALAKNKVFIVPEILEEQRDNVSSRSGSRLTYVILKMKYTIYAEDGSHIETVLKGEAMDSGDKAINKAMAIAYKYLCFQIFCIPVEDMTDPDSESHEVKDDKKDNAGKKDKASEAKNKKAPESPKESEQKNNGGSVTEAMVNTIRSEQERTGVSDKAILSRLHTKAKRIEDLTVEEFNQVMKIFQVTKDLKQEAADGDK